ncbi:hypothetical protein SCCGRSA3_01331 [Marine Group I thaumarchaeote SCGC RSA3]|uniref:Uncharacterized protein n=1 Tax=Marine Group I thaumarchaeote SCGC RSA3 TaxID=1503183 RepID=A0A087RX92_9ARCH|nr:hypothetical protein SCCGRSA3_01331 [Marine Group I thaumarchaeote SCGC RSA3]
MESEDRKELETLLDIVITLDLFLITTFQLESYF